MFTQCLFAAALRSDYKEGQLGWRERNETTWHIATSGSSSGACCIAWTRWPCSLLSLTITSFGRTGWQEWLFTFSESWPLSVLSLTQWLPAWGWAGENGAFLPRRLLPSGDPYPARPRPRGCAPGVSVCGSSPAWTGSWRPRGFTGWCAVLPPFPAGPHKAPMDRNARPRSPPASPRGGQAWGGMRRGGRTPAPMTGLSLSRAGERCGRWDGWGRAGPAWGPTQGAVRQFWHDGHRVPGTGGAHRPLPHVELGGGGPAAAGDAASGQPPGPGKAAERRAVGSGCGFRAAQVAGGGAQTTGLLVSNILGRVLWAVNLINSGGGGGWNGSDTAVRFAAVTRACFNLCSGVKVYTEHLRREEKKVPRMFPQLFVAHSMDSTLIKGGSWDFHWSEGTYSEKTAVPGRAAHC